MIGVIIWFSVSIIFSIVFFVLSLIGIRSAETSFDSSLQGGGWEDVETITELTTLYIILLVIFTLSLGISGTILWKLVFMPWF
jgi:hypothetical protein